MLIWLGCATETQIYAAPEPAFGAKRGFWACTPDGSGVIVEPSGKVITESSVWQIPPDPRAVSSSTRGVSIFYPGRMIEVTSSGLEPPVSLPPGDWYHWTGKNGIERLYSRASVAHIAPDGTMTTSAPKGVPFDWSGDHVAVEVNSPGFAICDADGVVCGDPTFEEFLGWEGDVPLVADGADTSSDVRRLQPDAMSFGVVRAVSASNGILAAGESFGVHHHAVLYRVEGNDWEKVWSWDRAPRDWTDPWHAFPRRPSYTSRFCASPDGATADVLVREPYHELRWLRVDLD